MRVVIDTQIFVRATLGSLLAAQILQLFKDDRFELFLSVDTYSEFLEVVYRDKFKKAQDMDFVDLLISILRDNSIFIETTKNIPLNSRDPKDNKFIELAFSANVDYLVSDDKELLSLANDKNLENIHIISLIDFLQIFN